MQVPRNPPSLLLFVILTINPVTWGIHGRGATPGRLSYPIGISSTTRMDPSHILGGQFPQTNWRRDLSSQSNIFFFLSDLELFSAQARHWQTDRRREGDAQEPRTRGKGSAHAGWLAGRPVWCMLLLKMNKLGNSGSSISSVRSRSTASEHIADSLLLSTRRRLDKK